MTTRAHFQISGDGELGQTAKARGIAQKVDALLGQTLFEEACKGAWIKSTRRQARKWLRRKGLAWAASRRVAP